MTDIQDPNFRAVNDDGDQELKDNKDVYAAMIVVADALNYVGESDVLDPNYQALNSEGVRELKDNRDVYAALLVVIDAINNMSGSGEVNTASNIGNGVDVFAQKVLSDLQFRRMQGGGNIQADLNGDSIKISDIQQAANTLFGRGATSGTNQALDNTALQSQNAVDTDTVVGWSGADLRRFPVSSLSGTNPFDGAYFILDYAKSGPINNSVTFETHSAFTNPSGHIMFPNASKVELIGFQIIATSGGASQATTATFSLYEYEPNNVTQRGFGAGNLVYSNTDFTSLGAEATAWYRSSSLYFPEAPVEIDRTKMLFLDLEPLFYSFTDVEVNVLLKVTA